VRRELRIAVAGAGAVGSVFGGKLAAAGHDVLLVGRDPHMAEVARAGLRISGVFGDTHARPKVATDLADAAGAYDAVLITVKSHATREVARRLATWRPAPALAVSLQNGLGNAEAIAEELPRSRVLAGRVIFGAVVEAPGFVDVTVNARPVAIGPLRPDGSAADVARGLAAAIDASGIPCEPVASTEPLLWEKVLYNCGLNPLGALHGLTYGEVVASERTRAKLDAAIREGWHVARAAGISLRWRDADEFLDYFYSTLLPPTAAHRSSMRQDLEAGRRTEIDAISGAIARAGARLGIATPIADELVAAVRAAEATARPR